MNTNEMLPAQCPGCGYEVNAATSLHEEARPMIGDFTVCLNCGTVSVFGAGFKLTKPTAEELDALRVEEPEVFAELSKATRFILQRGRYR